MSYSWSVHVTNGINFGMARKEEGTRIFAREQSLMIHVGGDFPVVRLRISTGLPAIGHSELRRRATVGLRSKDAAVCVSAFQKADLVFAGPSAVPLAKAFDDPDEYMKRCAALALGRLGMAGEPALPGRQAAGKKRQRLCARLARRRSRRFLKAPPHNTACAAKLRETEAEIAAFLDVRRKEEARRSG